MKKPLPFDRAADFTKEYALAHELPYWDFLENEVVLVDGTLVVGLKASSISIETMDMDTLNRVTLEIRNFLNSISDGFEISFVSHVQNDYMDVIHAHTELGNAHPVSKWLSEERARVLQGAALENSLLRPGLFIYCYQRARTTQTKRLGIFATPKHFVDTKKAEHETRARELHQTVDTLASVLSGLGMRCEKLKGQDAFHLAYNFLNPERSKTLNAPRLKSSHQEQLFSRLELQKEAALSLPSPREQLVFSDVVSQYDTLFYDNHFHRCITLQSLPEYTHSALIARLSELSFPHTLHVHVRVPEQSKELSLIHAKRRMAHSMSISHNGRASDLESEARLNSTEELLRDVISSGQKIFYFQCVILLRAATREELEMWTKHTLAKVREMNGAEGTAETVGTFKVWKSLLPIGSLASPRLKRVKAENLADLLPIFGPFTGSDRTKPVVLFQNRSQNLVAYDPFDPRRANYNTLVTGSSGSGKSFINNLILLQYLSQKPKIFIIDIGGSYRKLCEALDGEYLQLLPPDTKEVAQTINPFLLPKGQKCPSPQKVKFLLSLFETILTDSGSSLSKLEKSLLEEALISLYEAHPEPTMSVLADCLAKSKDQRLKDFSVMLFPWTGDRPYGRLLDGKSSFDISKDVVVFDLKGLSAYPDLQAVMLLIVTDFILSRIDDSSAKKQILMDECWELLKSSASQNFMEYCVRTLRKSGSGITFITQGLEEIIQSPIGPAILSNTATKFVLSQKGDLDPVRKVLKLNDREMSLISSLSQVKGLFSEAFLMTDDHTSVIRVLPTPLEYWLSTSDAADNELIEKTRRHFPEKSLREVIRMLATSHPRGAEGGTP